MEGIMGGRKRGPVAGGMRGGVGKDMFSPVLS